MTFRFLEIINLAILDKKTVPRVMVMGNMLKYEPHNQFTLILDIADFKQNRHSKLQYKTI